MITISNEKIEELFNEAINKYDENNFNEAILIFEEILKEDKDNIKAIEDIGACYGKLGDNKKALEKFNEALALANNKNDNESIIDISINKISSLFKLKDYDQIIAFTTETIEKVNISEKYNGNKLKSDLLNYIGIAKYYLNNYEESIKKYDEAIKLYPYNTSAYKNKGLSLQKLGNNEEAERCFNMSVKFEKKEEYKMYIQSLSGVYFSLTLNTIYQCIIFDLIGIFSEIDYKTHKITFSVTHKMTKELSDKIKKFVGKYSIKNGDNEFVQGLIIRFAKIHIGDYFCIFPGKDKVTAKEFFYTITHLKKESGIESEDNIKKIEANFMDIFSSSIMLYDIDTVKKAYNIVDSRNYKKKQLMICKYCGNMDTDISNKSHIIPKSLGGNLLDEEECKNCNSKFGATIERDLGKYLSPWKTIYNINGHNKIPKFNARNGFIIRDEKGKLNIGAKNIEVDNKGMPKKITFDVGKINMKNVYRALVKISMGFIEREKIIKDFPNTIKFINGELKDKKLPPIITYFNKNISADEKKPVFVSLFYRKENVSKEFPYLVSEFIFYNFSFIYIVPFSSKDRMDFSDKDKFDNFNKNWHSYKFNYGLIYCNKDEEVDFSFSINFDIDNDKIIQSGIRNIV